MKKYDRGRKPRAVKNNRGAPRNQPRRASAGVIGRLSMTERGFGFVTTDKPGPDIMVRAPSLGGALHGDRVRISAERGLRGLNGRVLEVVERGASLLSGTLLLQGKRRWIEPEAGQIPGKVWVHGELPPGAVAGSRVIARFTRCPEHGQEARASILDAADPSRPAEFEVLKIRMREGIEERFPAEVEAEAAALPRAVTGRDQRGREDLRELDLVTIDPEDARDHDDAVWAARLASGGFRLVVAIADVSHYVTPGGAIDREARERGCTIYLPDRAIAMLPPELSSNLASLLPDRDRLVLAIDMELGADGAVRSRRFIEGVMRSGARLSYGGVATALGLSRRETAQPAAEARRESLQTLLDLSLVLRRGRLKRGALMFDLPEAKVSLHPETGEPRGIERLRKDPGVAQAYNLVEELMLLANEVTAQELAERGFPAIYRVHPEPDAEKIEGFIDTARSLGYMLDIESVRQPKKLARFLGRIERTPHAGSLNHLLLRALPQAVYDTHNSGHFALATDNYLHFTSPIRRYPDLAVHRLVRAVARGERPEGKALHQALGPQARHASQRERRAMKVERETVDLYRAWLMRDRIGEVFEAAITSVTERGLYASLDAPFVDVMCPLEALPRDRYQLDRFALKLTGLRGGACYAIGDRINLRISEVSIPRRQVWATPAAAVPGRTIPFQRPKPDRRGIRRRKRSGR